MNRYEWLQRETGLIPRKKFFVFESRSLSVLSEVEAQYGRLPPDYREFVRDFGKGSLFRSPYCFGYNLLVQAPPVVVPSPAEDRRTAESVMRIKLGYYTNTGAAWLEWAEGVWLHEGAIFVGLTMDRRKAAVSFEEWLKRSFAACRKDYSKAQLKEIAKPVPPFSAKEQRILEAIPQFTFRKVGVAANGNVLVEIENRSSMELPYFTVGVRDKSGMSGATALIVSGIAPGTTDTIEQSIYKGSDPHQMELFRLPLPEPEDRPYYRELRENDVRVS